MAIDRTQFFTRTPLEDFAVRWANKQTDFISDEVAPPFYVKKTKFSKYQYDLSNMKEVETQKDSKAEADKVDYGVFKTDANTKPHKLAAEIDPRDSVDFDTAVADEERKKAAVIMEKLLIRRESLLVSKVSDSSNFASGLSATLGAAATWASDGGDPEGDAKTARIATKGACGKPANALALSWTALEHLKQSAALKDRLKYTSGQSLTVEQIKNLLGLQYLDVCAAQKNTAAEGAADAMSDVWDDFALFYVKDPSQDPLEQMTFMRNFMLSQMYSYTWEEQRRGSAFGRIRVLEMGWEYTHEAAAVDSAASGKFVAGYLLDNVY